MLLIELCEQWKSPRCDVQERFGNAIAVNPDVAATYALQGIYLFRATRLPAAIASFEKALTLDPNSLNAHYNLGLAYFETKQFELANAHAQRAYQLGASVPGLRDKLKRAGHWKPIDTPMSMPRPRRLDSQPSRPWIDNGDAGCTQRSAVQTGCGIRSAPRCSAGAGVPYMRRSGGRDARMLL
jgi:tetratricopeptide (TPR) repeat protein